MLNNLPSQRVFWDEWWKLMDALQEFPKWLRAVPVPASSDAVPYLTDKDHPYSLRQELGDDWVTLAITVNSEEATVWGYFGLMDRPHLLEPVKDRLGVAATPPFLKGTEE